MFACACALSLLLSLSLTRSHYIRDGKTFQTETSIQIIEKDDFVESKIIPRVCTHEVEAELGLAACPLEVPSTLSAAFLEDRPVDAERQQDRAQEWAKSVTSPTLPQPPVSSQLPSGWILIRRHHPCLPTESPALRDTEHVDMADFAAGVFNQPAPSGSSTDPSLQVGHA
jgi:hypothetical protein